MEESVLTRCISPLCELAEKHGTDKLGVYTPFYDLLLRHNKNKILMVLEIGIGTPETMKHVKDYKAGASLRMWREYFPNATIIGADKSDVHNEVKSERIGAFHVDQESSEDLERITRLGATFDLIVDDGSHDPEDQLRTFHFLYPLLRQEGIYIIEDVDDVSVLSRKLPEHTMVWHAHNYDRREIGRCIVIRQGHAI